MEQLGLAGGPWPVQAEGRPAGKGVGVLEGTGKRAC